MAFQDEETPLLRQISSQDPESLVKHDEVILDFEPEDSENPRNWPAAFKWCIVLLLASMAFTVTFTCIGVVPVASRIVEDLDGRHASSSSSALIVTIWELGEAAGPLLIAPLSEVLGRYPVMNGCNVFFIIWTVLAAYSKSTNVFIAARMLTGLAVAANVLNPAIIGDMFESDQRGSAMSLIMLAPLIGGAIGPAISGAIAQTLGWRQVLLIAAGLALLCEMLFLFCFRETFKLAILHKKAARFQKECGLADSVDEKGAHDHMRKLWHAITRPFAVLFGSRVMMLISLFAAVAFSFFYVMSITLPDVLQEQYGFSPAQAGSAFVCFSVGSFMSVFVCNFALDRIFIKLRGPNDTKGKPEYRLPLTCVGAFALPLSVIAYGWITELHLPVPYLLASVALLGFTLLLTVIPISAYVVDACGMYSASAMTGVIVARCLAGTFLPLLTNPLVEKFGWGQGFSCLGGLSLALASIPVLLLRYGSVWRQKSEFTRDV